MAIIKNLQVKNAGEGIKKMESSYTICGNVIWYIHYGEQNEGSFSLVQFSRSVMSDSLRLHELQHARPPCPSPTPGVHPNPCPLCRWCHPSISSSVVPFSSWPQYFPASGSFQMSQLSASGGQSIGVPFRMDWLDLLAVQGTLRSLLQHHSSKASILQRSAFFTV